KEVAINNNHLAISGPGNGPNYWKVALYKFDHLNLTWQSTNTLSNGGSFGNSTDLYEDYMLIGQKDYYDSWYHGNAHLYHFQNNNWVFVNDFKKNKYAAEGTHIKFGSSVGLENGWLAIGDNEFQRGSPYYDNKKVGGIFVYKNNGGNWQENITLIRNEQYGVSRFGTSMDINKNNLIIGAPGDASDYTEYDGKAFIYEYKNNSWNNATVLNPSGICSSRNFGRAVAVTDSFAFVSSPFHGSAGSVIVYKKVNNNWVFAQILMPTVTSNISEFGGSISCSIDYLVISAKEYTMSQKVYVFRLVNNQWVQHKQFNVTYSYDNSDIPVSIYKDKIAAGAPGSYYYYGGQNHQTGAAYVWTNNLALSKSNIELVQGITENEVPEEYGLSQNYPNPFNPSTVIKYQLPENSFVDLKIYDVLGREVSVLSNEFKGAGSYEAVFNASNLPSGIYFYKLTTSKFTEIKKMILLK
ncbi:MAG: T9SS type A sorting domain-containing protein, partial [Melioribacteraceae bacterium]